MAVRTPDTPVGATDFTDFTDLKWDVGIGVAVKPIAWGAKQPREFARSRGGAQRYCSLGTPTPVETMGSCP